MKKTINTLICGVMSFFVFATPLQVKSQTIPYQAITEKNDINTHINPILPITKSLYPQMALTYYEHYGASTPINNVRGVFLRNNAAQSIDSFLVPDNIYITDFVELPEDGRIFFCGYKNISVTEPKDIGIIGYFNYTNNQVNFHYTEVPEVFSFTKVEAFNVNGVISEVAIAKEHLYSSPKIIFCIPDILNSTNYNMYNVRYGQTLWDIVYTQDYVAFVGYDYSFPGICIRKAKLVNIANPTELDYVYGYTMPDNEPTGNLTATFLGNDHNRVDNYIAVSTPTFLNDSNIESRFRTIDISTMDMPYSQKFPLVTKIDTYGMTYLNHPNILAALLTSEPEVQTNHTPIVLLDPFPSANYTASYVYRSNIYHSIDNLNQSPTDADHFIVGGYASNHEFCWFLKDVNTLDDSNQCYHVDSVKVELIKNIEVLVDIDNLSNQPKPFTFLPLQIPIINKYITIDCLSF